MRCGTAQVIPLSSAWITFSGVSPSSNNICSAERFSFSSTTPVTIDAIRSFVSVENSLNIDPGDHYCLYSGVYHTPFNDSIYKRFSISRQIGSFGVSVSPVVYLAINSGRFIWLHGADGIGGCQFWLRNIKGLNHGST